jgi:hypothetical protein
MTRIDINGQNMRPIAETLNEFEIRRRSISNLSYQESQTRLRGFYQWLMSNSLTKELLDNVASAADGKAILSAADRNSAPRASTVEEIDAVALHILKLVCDGTEPYRIAFDRGISPFYRSNSKKAYFDQLMERYITPLVDNIERRLAAEARDEAEGSDSAKSGDARGDTPSRGKGMDWTKESESKVWSSIKDEFDVSKTAFGLKIRFIQDEFARSIIFRDVAQAYILSAYGFSKPAVILSGSVCEELLRSYLIYKQVSVSKDTFDAYIQACTTNGLLKSAIQGLANSVRHFRNLVHMSNEKSKRHTISKSTAKAAVASIFSLVYEFEL